MDPLNCFNIFCLYFFNFNSKILTWPLFSWLVSFLREVAWYAGRCLLDLLQEKFVILILSQHLSLLVFFSRPSPKAGHELQTVLNRMMSKKWPVTGPWAYTETVYLFWYWMFYFCTELKAFIHYSCTANLCCHCSHQYYAQWFLLVVSPTHSTLHSMSYIFWCTAWILTKISPDVFTV